MNSSRVAVCALRNEQAATLLEFMYHSGIVLSVGGSVVYMIRNLHCTVTIDSVLANSKTQNAFLFTANAIFLYDYLVAVEPGSTPRPLVQKKKLGEILCLLICSFLQCLSWLLRSRFRKSRRDLWITLYNFLLPPLLPLSNVLLLSAACQFLLITLYPQSEKPSLTPTQENSITVYLSYIYVTRRPKQKIFDWIYPTLHLQLIRVQIIDTICVILAFLIK